MKTLNFKDRGKALEDIFFQAVDQKLLGDLRAEMTEKTSKRALRRAIGIWNDEVLAELVHLGVEPETILAVSMIPLVAVAWADGNVSPEERQRILEAEEAQQIDENSPTGRLLNHWLDNNPGPGMFEAWRHFVNELRGQLSPAKGTLFDAELIERVEAVAKASGGYWTYGAISPSEKKVIAEGEGYAESSGIRADVCRGRSLPAIDASRCASRSRRAVHMERHGVGRFVGLLHARSQPKIAGRDAGHVGRRHVGRKLLSLLAPAIEISKNQGGNGWLPAAIGFLTGGVVLLLLDKLLPHLHLGHDRERAEGPPTSWDRSVLLVMAITLHNIPEGLAVGVAFGGIVAGEHVASLAAAIALTLGIGLQNFPEGAAVAMPLRMEGMSRRKAFWYGQLSAVVEPFAAVVGAMAVTHSVAVLPFALSFAAGAMVFVVVEELIPESHQAGNVDLATISLMAGFTVMMVLDVALG